MFTKIHSNEFQIVTSHQKIFTGTQKFKSCSAGMHQSVANFVVVQECEAANEEERLEQAQVVRHESTRQRQFVLVSSSC